MPEETIKQSVARCRGSIFVLLHPNYSDEIAPLRLQVSKPEARRLVIDRASKDRQPKALWEGRDLILMPAAQEE